MVHVYKIGISGSVFTDHRMLNSEIRHIFYGRSVLLYLSDAHTYFYV